MPPDERESIPLTEAAAALVAKAITAARAGRRQEALDLCDQALDLDENNVKALLWRGALSEPADAVTFLERAVRLDPSNPKARQGLDWARQRAGLRPLQSTAAEAPVPAAQPPSRPVPAQTTIRLPNALGFLSDALLFLVNRPSVALAIVIAVMALLGTAAVARAAMSRGEMAQATPVPRPTEITAWPTAKNLPAGIEDPRTVKPTATTAAAAAPTAGQPAATTKTGVAIASPSQPTPTRTATPTLVVVVSAANLDKAWADKDWPLAVAILERMRQATPNDTALTQKLFTAYMNLGVQLVRSEELKEAIAAFDKALEINPNDEDARGQRGFAQLYYQGTTALERGDFEGAYRPLSTIYASQPNYRQVAPRLYQAYMGAAAELEKAGNYVDAFQLYQKASYVDKQSKEAKDAMLRIKDKAGPLAAAALSGKRIEVNLTKQQATLWFNDKVVARFTVATGRAPYITRTGDFNILNKIPEAYSTALGWGMPYWMGIYQAGSTENGFHGMARLRDGRIMPESSLGRPQTSGCVMLSDKDALFLYNWADIGTPVSIHY